MRESIANYDPYYYNGELVGFISKSYKTFQTKRNRYSMLEDIKGFPIYAPLYRQLKKEGVYRIIIIYEDKDFFKSYSLNIHEFRERGKITYYNKKEYIFVEFKNWVNQE